MLYDVDLALHRYNVKITVFNVEAENFNEAARGAKSWLKDPSDWYCIGADASKVQPQEGEPPGDSE